MSEHSANILFISVTLLVLNVFKSKLARLEHPQNIPFILVTLLVSKLDKSIVLRPELI